MGKLNTILLQRILLVGLGIFILGNSVFAGPGDQDSLLQRGRVLFYGAVKDKAMVEETQRVFERLSADNPGLAGRALTYIGGLTALRGKHATWPQQKFNYVQEGLKQMEQGIAKDSTDIESLFIYGSTCYHLPFFFGQSDEAQEAFQQIITLLPDQIHNYDPAVIRNVISFLEENAELNSSDVAVLERAKEEITNG